MEVATLPFSVGERVQVVAAVELDIHDVSRFIGKTGRVVEVLKEAGIGDTYPEDPVLKVKFVKHDSIFWKEELRSYTLTRMPQSTRALKVAHLMLVSRLERMWRKYYLEEDWYFHPAHAHSPMLFKSIDIGRELRRRGKR